MRVEKSELDEEVTKVLMRGRMQRVVMGVLVVMLVVSFALAVAGLIMPRPALAKPPDPGAESCWAWLTFGYGYEDCGSCGHELQHVWAYKCYCEVCYCALYECCGECDWFYWGCISCSMSAGG